MVVVCAKLLKKIWVLCGGRGVSIQFINAGKLDKSMFSSVLCMEEC